MTGPSVVVVFLKVGRVGVVAGGKSARSLPCRLCAVVRVKSVGCGTQGVLGRMDRIGDELPGVPVLQAVVDLCPFLPGCDHLGKPHFRQVL